jgi:RNA polymerase sigma-32 factor
MTLDDQYSLSLARIPTMPAAEQKTLAERYARTRDRKDAERLVLGNLRLVLKLAGELGGRHRNDFMDLVQEGNAGLMHAVERFDPKRDVKLSSYAGWWIRAYMMRYLMDTSRIVRHTSTREGRRRFFDRTLPADVSLDAPAHRDDGGARRASVLDTLLAGDDSRPDVLVERREYLARVREATAAFPSTLDERGRTILKMRTLSEKPARLADVGRRLAISGERARQLEARVLGGLRDFVGTSLGEPGRAAA